MSGIKFIHVIYSCVTEQIAPPLTQSVNRWGERRLFYANSEPQPNAKYSCAASVAISEIKLAQHVFSRCMLIYYMVIY